MSHEIIELDLGLIVNNLLTNKDFIKKTTKIIILSLRHYMLNSHIYFRHEKVQFMKAPTIVIIRYTRYQPPLVFSHFFSVKVSPEWRLNPSFAGPRKRVPFPEGSPQ